MAADKPGFILYNDQAEIFLELDDTKAGKLIKHIFKYVKDENPELTNQILKIAFSSIKAQLKRDLKKYISAAQKKSEAGILGNLKRWNLDLYEQVIKGNIDLNEAANIAQSRKPSHSDNFIANVAVTDTVTVKDTVTDIYISDKKENLLDQWFEDLKTGNQINEIARTSKIDVKYFLDRIEPFRKAANTNYTSHYEFLNHFKKWSILNSSQPKQQGSSIKLGKKQ